MNLTGDLATNIERLDKVIDLIVEAQLTHQFNGHTFPYEKVRLSLDDFLQLTLMRQTETLQFGMEMREQRSELWLKGERHLIEAMRNAYWWPAVDGLWHFQCFESRTEEQGISDIYYLVRIGEIKIITNADPQVTEDIYWIGVKSKKCYL